MIPEITASPLTLLGVALAAYLLGSVPFGMVFARLFGLGDLRAIGSGNIGTTNVLRTGNKAAAGLTLVMDAGKGGVAVLVAGALWGEDAAQSAGLTAFLGHLFPIWIGFRGGKGVATFLGTALALAWPVGLVACAAWLAVAVLFRISSLAALTAAVAAPVAAWLLGPQSVTALLAALSVLIFIRHKENIARLVSGQEPRIGQK